MIPHFTFIRGLQAVFAILLLASTRTAVAQVPLAHNTKPQGTYVPGLIQRDNTPIRSDNNTVLVGQQINLSLHVGQTPATNIQWTLPATTFKDYQPTADHDPLTSLTTQDLNQSAVSFYWSDGTDAFTQNPPTKKVQVTFTLNGKIENSDADFKVLSPHSELYVASLGTLQVREGRVGLLAPPNSNLNFFEGIKFESTASLPDGFAQGECGLLQTVNETHTAINTAGNTVHGSFDNQQALDSFPLSGGTTPPTVNDPQPVNPPTWLTDTADSLPSHTVSDRPQISLTDLTKLSANKAYATYLMFKPAGGQSKYVPLRVVTWSWSLTNFQPTQGIWQDPTNTATSTPAPTTFDITTGAYTNNAPPTSIHPTWTIKWLNSEAPGGFHWVP